MFTPSSLSDVYPAIQLYGMPLVFRSLEEVDYVRSKMDQQLLEGLEQAGFVGFGLAEGGFAEILSNVPVTGIDDLKGRKVWIPEGDIITYNTMQAMGLSPVTLPITDVMTGLQTGLIDIVASSPVGAVVMQWHTKVKYVTNFPLAYLLGLMVVSKKDFDKLEAADQQVVREVFGRVYQGFDKQNREDNGAAAQALLDSGLQAVELDDEEVRRWREVVSASNREMAERGIISKDLLNQLLAYVEEFRAKAVPAEGTR
jgi:TRAP-type C4-dicarboxylate transport system substrate-binding protein